MRSFVSRTFKSSMKTRLELNHHLLPNFLFKIAEKGNLPKVQYNKGDYYIFRVNNVTLLIVTRI